MNLTTLDHIYKEFGSIEWRSFQDFCANMLEYTKDYGCFIIDNNDPNARGRERFFHYTANPELPKFTLFCKAAWQSFSDESRAEAVNKQRKEFKQTNKYSANYLKQLKNAEKSRISYAEYFGQTEEAARAKDDNPFKTLLRGAK